MRSCRFGSSLAGTPARDRKAKSPFVEVDGALLGDSEHIIETLSERFGVDLDQGLNPADRAAGHAFRRLFEEHLYWILVYSRWLENEPFEVLNKAFFSKLPPVLRSIVPVVAKRSLRKTLHGHGLGRHTPEQIYAKAEQDLQAASDFLGDKPFFLGEQPRTVDASAFGILTGMIDATLKTPLTPIAGKFENLCRLYQPNESTRLFGSGRFGAVERHPLSSHRRPRQVDNAPAFNPATGAASSALRAARRNGRPKRPTWRGRGAKSLASGGSPNSPARSPRRSVRS